MSRARNKATLEEVQPDPSGPFVELALSEPEAVIHLKDAIRSGKEWHLALLEAVGIWTLTEEHYGDRHYQYVIHGEAFDWVLLAERLCCELDGLVPVEEKERLLFHGVLPGDMDQKQFRDLIGANKHGAYLNYWYGVVVEEALQLAVEEEVRKQHRARSMPDSEELVEEAFVRLYQDTRTNLAQEYLRAIGAAGRKSMTLTQLTEFTYRLFKRRVNLWDPARVASDTRKGLNRLRRLQAGDRSLRSQAEP